MEPNASESTLLYLIDYFNDNNVNVNNNSSSSSAISLATASRGASSGAWNESVVRLGFNSSLLERDGGNSTVSWTEAATIWNDAVDGDPTAGSQYPSGYSQLRIIMTSFFVTIIMILVVVGNMLVCIAIATEKSLKTVQNWFIASLAVSDFLLGLVIMPFSLANEVMGYWIFGKIWCEIHSALDVLLCTASINNLCLISLDRYWSVTQAVEYLKKRTPSRALFMICFVWALSALISLPPLVGWKKKTKESAYPSCDISDDIGYVLYSAFGSFYIPAVVMVFVYIRIFVAARSRARKHVKKRQRPEVTNDPIKDKSTTTTTCTSFSNPSPPERGQCFPTAPSMDSMVKENGAGGSGTSAGGGAPGGAGLAVTAPRSININVVVETKKRPPSVVLNATPQIIIETPEESSSVSPSPGGMYDYDEEYEERGRTKFFGDKDARIYHVGRDCLKPGGLSPYTGPSQYVAGRDGGINPSSEAPTAKTGLLTPDGSKRDFGSTMSLADYERSDVEVEDEKDGAKSGKNKDVVQVSSGYQHQVMPPMKHTATEAERHRRKVAKARERRATLILGLIMGSFILAWLPFFVLYVLEALCSTCYINPTGFAVAFWLGYCNSALNPIIYTIFNRDFRRAFKKILFK